ncbi:hypothetical protein ACWGIB_17800 [Streptomyces xiamenensis]
MASPSASGHPSSATKDPKVRVSITTPLTRVPRGSPFTVSSQAASARTARS